jgi:hypothetical protein
MKQLAFLLRNTRDFTLFTYATDGNLSTELDRKDFASIDVAIAFAKQSAHKVCNFTRLRIDAELFTIEHAEQLMRINQLVDDAAGFVNIAQDAAYLLSATVCDEYVVALQKTGDWMDEPVEVAWTPEVSSLEQARKIQSDFNNQHDVGGSTYGGGEIYRNGTLVGYLSYNGRLWDAAGWGGAEHQPLTALRDA